MALLDKIKELFGGREEPRDELGRHPDAQPITAEQNERGPTPEEIAAAAAAQPPVATVDAVADDALHDATGHVAERTDNPISELERPGVDLPPEGAEEPPR
ncbi:MAG TPA: hypothetical protein VEY87_11650 [Gaiellaceae bacterium]|jgi:hypothetical protein|nr:hypothetical protein [Gaiellaceae bacterium]